MRVAPRLDPGPRNVKRQHLVSGRVPLPADVLAGIRHFNAGEYFEAHEAWEDHWGHGGVAERELMLGLIKAAVALHHLAHRNEAGFHWQAKEAIPRLRAHHAVWPELRLGHLAEELDSLVSQARFHGSVPAAWERPRIAEPLGDP